MGKLFQHFVMPFTLRQNYLFLIFPSYFQVKHLGKMTNFSMYKECNKIETINIIPIPFCDINLA